MTKQNPPPLFRYPVAEGWQCPLCYRVWSPMMIQCEPCNTPKSPEELLAQ